MIMNDEHFPDVFGSSRPVLRTETRRSRLSIVMGSSKSAVNRETKIKTSYYTEFSPPFIMTTVKDKLEVMHKNQRLT